jgi:transposase
VSVKVTAQRSGVSPRSVKRIVSEARMAAAKKTKKAKAAPPEKRKVGRPSKVEPHRAAIKAMLAEDAELPTGEILRRLADGHGYEGGKSAVFDFVAKLRKPASTTPMVRFEGLPGEFSQHDFGEVRVTYRNGESEKIVFFASRLKYSRFVHVVVVPNQREEALVRSLVDSFDAFHGVPLVAVFDNPKTVVVGRKEGRPIWNSVFQQAAFELGFVPELCAPRSGNQKGAVENLVGWVKGSFFKVRRFQDRADLEAQLAEWLLEVNHRRPSRATNEIPAVRLAVEKKRLRPLRVTAADFAIQAPVVAAPTGFVEHEGIRYGIPGAIGIPGTLYLFRDRVRIVAGPHERLLPRYPEVGRDVILPSDREALVGAVRGARGKLYSMRQQVLDLGADAVAYLTEIRHRRPQTWQGEFEQLYEALVAAGPRRLLTAIRLAASRALFGADYVLDALKEVAA